MFETKNPVSFEHCVTPIHIRDTNCHSGFKLMAGLQIVGKVREKWGKKTQDLKEERDTVKHKTVSPFEGAV